MKYEMQLTEEAEAVVNILKPILGVETTDEVLGLCLGFVYQLMELATENEQVRQFVAALGEQFKLKQGDHSKLN